MPTTTKPVKPRRDFPLTAHPRGSWCKKIDGKLHYFGPWSDPDGAEKEWKRFETDRQAGRTLRKRSDGRLAVKDLVNAYLRAQSARASHGTLRLRTFRELQPILEDFLKAVGKGATVGSLTPDDFMAYRAELIRRGLGSHALKRHTTLVRSVFRWGYDQDLFERLPKYGSGFGEVRSLATTPKAARMFTADEVRTMIAAAGAPLKAMILLGINCGFGNTDVGSLPMKAVDLKAGSIDYARVKTGIARKCILWPETVAAIQEAIEARRRPMEPADADILFTTRSGSRFVSETPVLNDGIIVDVKLTDSLSGVFRKLLGECGVRKVSAKGNSLGDGRGAFYTLRRTFRTWADEVGDHHAAALCMGHAFGSIAGIYVQQISDERLRKVTDHVRSKVFT